MIARLWHRGLMRLVGLAGVGWLVKHLWLQPRYMVLALTGAIFGVRRVRLEVEVGVRQLRKILVPRVSSRNAPLMLKSILFRGDFVDRTVVPIIRLALLPRMTPIPRLARLANLVRIPPDIVNELRARIIILLGGGRADRGLVMLVE